MKDNVNIVGAHGERRASDFYPTPPECTVALMDFLERQAHHYDKYPSRHDPTRNRILEPASGDGAISKVLESRGYHVVSRDIRTDVGVYGETGIDFLTSPAPECDWIITNPPFCLAEQFIRRCRELGKPFALLLKSQYWHSSKRMGLFQRIKPDFVLPLTWRPDFTGKGASLMDVAWSVWSTDFAVKDTRYIPLGRPKRKEA